MDNSSQALGTVAQYNELEQHARYKMPNRILEAASPETFLRAGYPTTIHDISQLVHYVDVMQENRFRPDYETLIEGLTVEEFDHYQKLSKKIVSFSEESFGVSVLPKNALLRSFISLRKKFSCWVFQRGHLFLRLGLAVDIWAHSSDCMNFVTHQLTSPRHFIFIKIKCSIMCLTTISWSLR